MAVNSIFHTSNRTAIATEQNLYRDLVAEAIQIYGHDVFYINRTLVAEDTVLGEDSLSVFRDATKIEKLLQFKKKEVLHTPGKVENWLFWTDRITVDGNITISLSGNRTNFLACILG